VCIILLLLFILFIIVGKKLSDEIVVWISLTLLNYINRMNTVSWLEICMITYLTFCKCLFAKLHVSQTRKSYCSFRVTVCVRELEVDTEGLNLTPPFSATLASRSILDPSIREPVGHSLSSRRCNPRTFLISCSVKKR